MSFTKKELQQDIDFLLERSLCAGSCRFGNKDRDTGRSSNALINFAYTGEEPNAWPHDESDYKACCRAVSKLPEHRRTKKVYKKLQEAKGKI